MQSYARHAQAGSGSHAVSFEEFLITGRVMPGPRVDRDGDTPMNLEDVHDQPFKGGILTSVEATDETEDEDGDASMDLESNSTWVRSNSPSPDRLPPSVPTSHEVVPASRTAFYEEQQKSVTELLDQLLQGQADPVSSTAATNQEASKPRTIHHPQKRDAEADNQQPAAPFSDVDMRNAQGASLRPQMQVDIQAQNSCVEQHDRSYFDIDGGFHMKTARKQDQGSSGTKDAADEDATQAEPRTPDSPHWVYEFVDMQDSPPAFRPWANPYEQSSPRQKKYYDIRHCLGSYITPLYEEVKSEPLPSEPGEAEYYDTDPSHFASDASPPPDSVKIEDLLTYAPRKWSCIVTHILTWLEGRLTNESGAPMDEYRDGDEELCRTQLHASEDSLRNVDEDRPLPRQVFGRLTPSHEHDATFVRHLGQHDRGESKHKMVYMMHEKGSPALFHKVSRLGMLPQVFDYRPRIPPRQPGTQDISQQIATMKYREDCDARDATKQKEEAILAEEMTHHARLFFQENETHRTSVCSRPKPAPEPTLEHKGHLDCMSDNVWEEILDTIDEHDWI